MASADGFTEVRRRGRKRHGPPQPMSSSQREQEEYSGPDVQIIIQKITACRQELKETQFYNEAISVLEQTPLSFSTVVCYGIGHIGTCHIARNQFALLMELVQLYRPHITWLYDPVLHEQEIAAATEYGFRIIPRNEHCKHRAGVGTLFFMPHCGKAMYNNLLWANWGRQQLAGIAIMGNSFSTYHHKLTSKQLLQEAPYIYHIQGVCHESPFPTSHPDSTIFNDTSLHTFPLDHTHTLDEGVWEHCPEPVVDPSDPEMIT